MKRITAAFPASAAFAFLLLTPYSHGQQSQRNVSEVVKATVDSVVLIVVNDGSGKSIAEGSGFIATSDGKIVTNHHVILGGHSAVVKLNSGAFFPVEGILADDPDHDSGFRNDSTGKSWVQTTALFRTATVEDLC